jgi:hypothetical protein
VVCMLFFYIRSRHIAVAIVICVMTSDGHVVVCAAILSLL